MRLSLIVILLALVLLIPGDVNAASLSLRGSATWYRYVVGGAAAGPALRRWLGAHWRGHRVHVCTLHGKCVYVRLTDWCSCTGRRVIDLDRRSFAKLAWPGRGVIEVRVYR